MALVPTAEICQRRRSLAHSRVDFVAGKMTMARVSFARQRALATKQGTENVLEPANAC